jgi:cation diffusion facilitator family transporter
MAYSTNADREKRWAAGSSVLAAVGLTTFKLVVGLSTGSLGILAEAAHSGLDLAATVMTYIAVRISGAPADREHTYGHGKFENLSAFVETILLLITCVWIIRGAVGRMISDDVHIEVTFWSFAVMGISILVDASRSRILYRAAKRHNSQALQADALHFSTDIWSSAVVILGLVSVVASRRWPGLAELHHADAVAALAVALIVIGVIARLGLNTLQALLDTAPPGLADRLVTAVEAVPGVYDCHHVRIRPSGANTFIDVHVLVDGGQTLEQAHQLTEQIEAAIGTVSPGADVTVHPEPLSSHEAHGNPEADDA